MAVVFADASWTYLGFVFVCRLIVVTVLLLASLNKLFTRRSALANSIKRFRLVPPAVAEVLSKTLPELELFVALTLLVGFLMPAPAYLAAGFLMIFTTAVAVNLLRGNQDIGCGCFSGTDERGLSWWLVWRNVSLTVAAIVASGVAGSASWSWPFAAHPSEAVEIHEQLASNDRGNSSHVHPGRNRDHHLHDTVGWGR
ncbi:MAG: MauE/DoxX family redox-associated membrane protein [Actinomycetota bacterium]